MYGPKIRHGAQPRLRGQRLLASTKGIQAILEGLREIRAYLEANGKLSQELRNELRQWCGPCAEQMLSILSDEDEDDEDEDEDAEDEKEPNTPEQIVEFLQELEKEEQMLMTRLFATRCRLASVKFKYSRSEG